MVINLILVTVTLRINLEAEMFPLFAPISASGSGTKSCEAVEGLRERPAPPQDSKNNTWATNCCQQSVMVSQPRIMDQMHISKQRYLKRGLRQK